MTPVSAWQVSFTGQPPQGFSFALLNERRRDDAASLALSCHPHLTPVLVAQRLDRATTVLTATDRTGRLCGLVLVEPASPQGFWTQVAASTGHAALEGGAVDELGMLSVGADHRGRGLARNLVSMAAFRARRLPVAAVALSIDGAPSSAAALQVLSSWCYLGVFDSSVATVGPIHCFHHPTRHPTSGCGVPHQ